MNLDTLFFLLNDFIGGADNDELCQLYGSLSLDKQDDRMIIIKKIKNHYLENFTDLQKADLKEILNCIISNNIDIYNIYEDFNDLLLPFYFSKNLLPFFLDIKYALNL